MLSVALTGTLSQGLISVIASILIVAAVFGLAIATLWALKEKLGVRLNARFSGDAATNGGGLRIVATGGGGYFLALVVLVFGGLYFVVEVLLK